MVREGRERGDIKDEDGQTQGFVPCHLSRKQKGREGVDKG